MFKKQVYVNEKKNKANPILIGIVMLVIGVSWTSNFYMFQDLQKEYNRAITIYNTAVSHRIDRERSGVMVQDIKTDVPKNGADTHASLNGDEGVNSPSTITEVEMSAYTSRAEETDSSPCISADGTNICEYDGCVVAYNALPLGSKVEVEGFGICTVKDRMNSRYSENNMDIYFGMDLQGALEFGRKKVKVKIINVN